MLISTLCIIEQSIYYPIKPAKLQVIYYLHIISTIDILLWKQSTPFETKNTIWTNKTRLQKLHTRAARLITGSDPRTSRVSMFKELGWLSLQWRRNLFNSNYTMHSYNTHNSSQLQASKSHMSTITVVSQYQVWTFGVVFLEISKKVLPCDVLKVHYLSLLVYNPNFNFMWLY